LVSTREMFATESAPLRNASSSLTIRRPHPDKSNKSGWGSVADEVGSSGACGAGVAPVSIDGSGINPSLNTSGGTWKANVVMVAS
jgi:hypothetical protein